MKPVEYKNFTIKVFADEDQENKFVWEIWKNTDCLDTCTTLTNFTSEEMALTDAKKEIDDEKWLRVFGDNQSPSFFS